MKINKNNRSQIRPISLTISKKDQDCLDMKYRFEQGCRLEMEKLVGIPVDKMGKINDEGLAASRAL
jgi:hypothetical protein